ncbi:MULTISPECIES: hypothetical protein [Anaeromyxobacter]|uniref:hypothetical protein n=1 Tax=Anaeromyxobacter TaxID=161492 RepID=UPI001F573464|nr:MULTISPECIES: hypothetical protein [unclassified Anaeromyxobacter]
MKRFAVVVAALALGVVIGSARRSHGTETDLCSGLTAARMLQDPELAREYFAALHGGDANARERFEAMVGELRAVHGCGGPAGESASQEPLGHSPAAPRLPPGHPPIGGAPAVPIFETQPGSTLEI